MGYVISMTFRYLSKRYTKKKCFVEEDFYYEWLDSFNFRYTLFRVKIALKMPVLEFPVSDSNGDQSYLKTVYKKKKSEHHGKFSYFGRGSKNSRSLQFDQMV